MKEQTKQPAEEPGKSVAEYYQQQNALRLRYSKISNGVPRAVRRAGVRKAGSGTRRERKARAKLRRIEEKYFG